MEKTENNLGGGPPSPEEERERAEHVQHVVAAAEVAALVGPKHPVIEALADVRPTSSFTPQQIEREDLLEYKLFSSQAAKAELQITMYHRELQRSQADANLVAHEAGKFMAKLEEKYHFDRNLCTITEDGYVVARPIDQRVAGVRK